MSVVSGRLSAMNGPRTRGRTGALAVVAVATLTALTLLQGSSIKTAYGRPLQVAVRGGLAAASYDRLPPVSVAAWEAFPPGADSAVIAPGRATVQVPILMYHYIRVPPDPASDRLGWGLSTSPEDFGRQMNYLDDNGYHPVTLTDLRGYLAGTQSLPDRPVVLTFDDGYSDVYTQAYPVLQRHHFRAVAYIVSGFVGRAGQNVMPDEVREMDANGIEIAAHTVNHLDLTKLHGPDLWNEVKGSKDALEALVGHPVLDFCYPSGRYDPEVVQAVEAAGYQSATTTESGAIHSLGDRFTWSRVRVSGSESMGDFARGLEQHESGVMPSRFEMIRVPRAFPLLIVGRLAALE